MPMVPCPTWNSERLGRDDSMTMAQILVALLWPLSCKFIQDIKIYQDISRCIKMIRGLQRVIATVASVELNFFGSLYLETTS